MSAASNPYYPPRARWYNCCFTLRGHLQRALHLRAIKAATTAPPQQISALQFWLSMALPCFAFHVCKQPVLGRILFAIYGMAFFVFVVWMGYPIATLALGLMILIHTMGSIRLIGKLLSGSGFAKVCFTFVFSFMGALFLYYMLQMFVERHIVLPLQTGNKVVVVRSYLEADSVKCGDVIAYRLNVQRINRREVVRSGYMLDRVLAMEGEKIRFSAENFEVKGLVHPRSAHMPTAGEWIVPRNHWFVSSSSISHFQVWFQSIFRRIP